MLKCSIHILDKVMHKLFNLVLANAKFPESWSLGDIVPLFKSGDNTDPNNYRGITISSSLGKLFTNILNTRLSKFLDVNNIINEVQIGFRQGFRTTDHIFVLNTLIKDAKNNKQTTSLCWIY